MEHEKLDFISREPYQKNGDQLLRPKLRSREKTTRIAQIIQRICEISFRTDTISRSQSDSQRLSFFYLLTVTTTTEITAIRRRWEKSSKPKVRQQESSAARIEKIVKVEISTVNRDTINSAPDLILDELISRIYV